VTWEGWDEMDHTWEPEDNTAKAKEIVKQYWKELGRRQNRREKRHGGRREKQVFFWMVERHRGVILVFRSGCFVSSRAFSKIIEEGCDVGGHLWS
jgi:hypothetical protein